VGDRLEKIRDLGAMAGDPAIRGGGGGARSAAPAVRSLAPYGGVSPFSSLNSRTFTSPISTTIVPPVPVISIRSGKPGKEYFIIEKDGIPVAGLMDIDEFEDYLELKDPTVRRQIQESYGEYRTGKSRPAGLLLSELKAKRGRRHRPAASRAV
jgi:hypothetical protein